MLSQVKANGLVVFVPKYGIEGPVYLTARDKNNAASTSLGAAAAASAGSAAGSDQPAGQQQQRPQQFLLDEEAQTVTSADGSVRFALFDKCAVRISVEEGVAHRRTLVLTLVDRNNLPEDERVG